MPSRSRSEHDDTEAVTAFIEALEHPLKPVLEKIRSAVLKADTSITAGIKWNTVSFYRCGWFATINLRAKTGVQVVLHHGAKPRGGSTLRETIEDGSDLLTWLGADRAITTFANPEDFQKKRTGFMRIIKQWAAYQARP